MICGRVLRCLAFVFPVLLTLCCAVIPPPAGPDSYASAVELAAAALPESPRWISDCEIRRQPFGIASINVVRYNLIVADYTVCTMWHGPSFDDHPISSKVAIVGHELGHAIEFDRCGSSCMEDELAADWWSGCAMARAGLPDTWSPVVRTWPEDKDHPAGDRRAQSIRAGFDACSMGR